MTLERRALIHMWYPRVVVTSATFGVHDPVRWMVRWPINFGSFSTRGNLRRIWQITIFGKQITIFGMGLPYLAMYAF